MKKISEWLNKVLDSNMYVIIFKILGMGFIIIGILTLVLPLKYDNRFVSGLTMFFGILFLGIGEIINLLQKILDNCEKSVKSRKKK